MHTMRRTPEGYRVGSWSGGMWQPLFLVPHLADALSVVNYMNGGERGTLDPGTIACLAREWRDT